MNRSPEYIRPDGKQRCTCCNYWVDQEQIVWVDSVGELALCEDCDHDRGSYV
jgi:hypothetical protein